MSGSRSSVLVLGPLHLVIDPGIGLGEPISEGDGWLPAVDLADQGVVGVAAPDALRSIELVVALTADAGDLLDDVDELVDRDQLGAAQIDRLGAVTPEDHL